MPTSSPVTVLMTSGPGDEHVRGLVHHHGEVGDGGGVDRAAGARAEDEADLRDDAGGVDVAAEDLRVQREGDDALLDPGAAGVVDADHRAADPRGEVHDLDDLLAEDLAEAAAEDGEVLGEDAHLAAVDGAVAGDDAVAVGAAVGHGEVLAAVPGQLVELGERARVEQLLDALARGALALGVLLVHGPRGARVDGLLGPPAQVGELPGRGVDVRARGGVLALHGGSLATAAPGHRPPARPGGTVPRWAGRWRSWTSRAPPTPTWSAPRTTGTAARGCWPRAPRPPGAAGSAAGGRARPGPRWPCRCCGPPPCRSRRGRGCRCSSAWACSTPRPPWAPRSGPARAPSPSSGPTTSSSSARTQARPEGRGTDPSRAPAPAWPSSPASSPRSAASPAGPVVVLGVGVNLADLGPDLDADLAADPGAGPRPAQAPAALLDR